jgi:magnesium-transporting ATPase (P-type)
LGEKKAKENRSRRYHVNHTNEKSLNVSAFFLLLRRCGVCVCCLQRTAGTVTEKGVSFTVTKGAPNIILALCGDNAAVKAQCEADVTRLGKRGIRAIAVAKTNAKGG